MAIFSLCQNTTVTTTAAPSFDIRASANVAVRLYEWYVNLGAATASTYGLGRPANDATPPVQTSTTALQGEDPNTPASQCTTALTWSTAPTVPAQHLRRIFLPATIGAGALFTFPRGILFNASRGLVNWNIAVSSASTNVHLVCDE